MKKTRRKFATLALALALMGSFILGAGASATYTAVTAYLNYGITIEYNGEEQQLYDANGVRLYPITYNDSTYVPIRAISNILGEYVGWDQATKTVILGTPTEGVDLLENYPAYSVHNPTINSSYYIVAKIADNRPQNIAGINVSHYLQMHSRVNGGVFEAYYNISNGNYGTVSFQVYSTEDITLEVRGDNDTVLASIPVTGSQLPKSVTVPLAGSKQLCLASNVAYADVYIFDVILK